MAARGHYAGLDALRATAILMVIARHAGEIIGKPLPSFFKHGWAGVDLFFVLSGFLIGSRLLADSLAKGSVDARTFYLRRAFRILPAYWVVLALYLFLPEVFRDAETMEPPWRFLLFVTNIGWTGGAFSHAWSLNVEEHFYLALPLLLTLHLWRPRVFRPAWMFALIFLGGAAVRWHAWSLMMPWSASIYRPTYCHLDGLAVGMLLALCRSSRPGLWEKLTAWPKLLGLGGAAFVAAGLWMYDGNKGQGAALLTFPLVSIGFGAWVAAALNPNAWLARARIPGATALALAAYSLYLTHKPMLSFARKMVHDNKGASVEALFWAAIFIPLAGALLYFLVERPSLKLRERFLPVVSGR